MAFDTGLVGLGDVIAELKKWLDLSSSKDVMVTRDLVASWIDGVPNKQLDLD